MPTRSGPFGLDTSSTSSAAKQTGVLRLVPGAREVGAKRRAAEIVERCGQARVAPSPQPPVQGLQQALARGVAERDQPHAGRDPIATTARARRRAMPARAECHGRRRRRQPRSDRRPARAKSAAAAPMRRARPGGSRDFEKGAAERRRFVKALAGRARMPRQVRRFRPALCRRLLVTARWACAKKIAVVKAGAFASASTSSHCRNVSASPISPASTAHSMPLE